MRRHLLWLSFVFFAFIGCSDDGGNGPPAEREAPLAAHCNPLSREHCLLPWPSSFYLAADDATATGYRVRYDKEALPANKKGVGLDPARYNLRDGFSVGSQPLVYFASGVSKENLPPADDLTRSMAKESPIWLLDAESGARVPFFAETDYNATAGEIPALIIRPQEVLGYEHRYVVALRTSLKDLAGEPLKAPEAFARLRDGLPTADATLEAQRASMEQLFTLLEGQGLPRQELVLAWEFRTGSEADATARMRFVLEDGLARLPAEGPNATFKHVERDEAADPLIWREGWGELEVPNYLTGGEADESFALDEAGLPKHQGMRNAVFRVHVPQCAKSATGPLPLLVVGHGLFRSVEQELESDVQRTIANRLCMIQLGVTWIGLSDDDLVDVAGKVIPDFTQLTLLSDRVQQAHLALHTLMRYAQTKLLEDPILQLDGSPLTDGQTIYYYGISNGGIQGTIFAALEQDIERFVLNVPGSYWTQMMERSSNFELLATLLATQYGSALDRLTLITFSQPIWDDIDPINYAHRVIADPLPGYSAKRVLVQEGIDDDQVPNATTRILVRRMGLSLLEPAVEPVYGVQSASGPLDSAYSQWEVDPPVRPYAENRPAEKPEDDVSAHKIPRRLEAAMQQIERFLRPDGQVEHTCGAEACRCSVSGGEPACVLGVSSL